MGACREGASLWTWVALWFNASMYRWGGVRVHLRRFPRIFTSGYFWHDTFGKYWHRLWTCRRGCADRRNVNADCPMEPIRLHCFLCERSLTIPPEYETAIRCWEAVRALTTEELEVVQIFYPNPDFLGPSYAIDVMGPWINRTQHGVWRRFTSDDSIRDCLEQAKLVKLRAQRGSEVPPRGAMQ